MSKTIQFPSNKDSKPVIYVGFDGYTDCALCDAEYVSGGYTEHIAKIPDETGENWETICFDCTKKHYPVLYSKMELVSSYANTLGETETAIRLGQITAENPELDMTLSEFKEVFESLKAGDATPPQVTWADGIKDEEKEDFLLFSVVFQLETTLALWRGGFNSQSENEELQKFLEDAAAFVDKHKDIMTNRGFTVGGVNRDDLPF